MADEETIDPFEQARRAVENVEQGSAGDRCQAAEDAAAAQTETDRVRNESLDMLLRMAGKLKAGDTYEHLLRQAYKAGLSDSQSEKLLTAIKGSAGGTLRSSRADSKRIAREESERAAREANEKAERQRSTFQQRNASDPRISDAYARYPPPLSGTIYDIYDDKAWAGRLVEDTRSEVYFAHLHTPFIIDGQLYLPPGDMEGLRLSVLHSSGENKPVHVRLGQLQCMQGRNDVMSAMADAGLRVTLKGREAILELLATSHHGRTIAVAGHPGFDGKRFIAPDGTVLE